jgi:Raf kinase inhibitor-like YbhB/YbcL family protein
MKFAALPFLALLAATPALAGSEGALAVAQLPAKAKLEVTSSTFKANGRIPLDVSAYGQNNSPALAWSAPPKGTKSFVLLVEDPDGSGPKPFVHWVVYNIPGTARSAPAGTTPPGASSGNNGSGKAGYHGPHPPAGGDHHYHFQLFALDQVLKVRLGVDRDGLVGAMKGHVLAEGDLVGLFAKP